MEQQLSIGWVLASWAVLVAYVAWDIRRIRSHAREEVRQLTDHSTSPEQRQRASRRIVRDFEEFHSSKERPLWWRWSRGMARVGNVIFAVLLGAAIIFTGVWASGGTLAESLRYAASLCLAMAILAVVAWTIRRGESH